MIRFLGYFTIAAKFMIRQLRTELGLSLRQTAARLGISESFLSQIENDKRRPSAALLHAIAELLKCNPDELALSMGLMPKWIETAFRESPVSAVKAARDEFKKYG